MFYLCFKHAFLCFENFRKIMTYACSSFIEKIKKSFCSNWHNIMCTINDIMQLQCVIFKNLKCKILFDCWHTYYFSIIKCFICQNVMVKIFIVFKDLCAKYKNNQNINRMPEMKSVAPTIVGKHNTSRRCMCTLLAIHSWVSFLTGSNDIVRFDIKEIPVFLSNQQSFQMFSQTGCECINCQTW